MYHSHSVVKSKVIRIILPIYDMPDREYFNNRRNKRRLRFINLLGGKCERCGSTEGLQFDHRQPNKKEFRISNRIDAPEDILLKEVMKCVLLCATCHRIKTKEMAEHGQPKARHGTLHMYKHYGCRCKKCRQRMSEYNRERRMDLKKLESIVEEFTKLAGDVLIFKRKTDDPDDKEVLEESDASGKVLEFRPKEKEPILAPSIRHHFMPRPKEDPSHRPAKVDPKEVLRYLEANPMATVGEAQRAILRRKRHSPCERCHGEGFSGLPEKQQRLGRMLGRSTCPECGR